MRSIIRKFARHLRAGVELRHLQAACHQHILRSQCDLTIEIVEPLHRLAHSRAGDKGATANISVIAYRAEFFPVLIEQVTVERVSELFRRRTPTGVRRYSLPKLGALNFVLENVLEGGVNEALNLDSHGKTLSFLLLGLEIQVPTELAALVTASTSGAAVC